MSDPRPERTVFQHSERAIYTTALKIKPNQAEVLGSGSAGMPEPSPNNQPVHFKFT
jgi:hypothetical protein